MRLKSSSSRSLQGQLLDALQRDPGRRLAGKVVPAVSDLFGLYVCWRIARNPVAELRSGRAKVSMTVALEALHGSRKKR